MLAHVFSLKVDLYLLPLRLGTCVYGWVDVSYLSLCVCGTVRLWSLEAMTNVVAYRGHLGATWTADWAPFSFYFATGGADRTARLWATEKSAALRLFAGHTSHVDVCLSLSLSLTFTH
jgi:WD40 repeat protein